MRDKGRRLLLLVGVCLGLRSTAVFAQAPDINRFEWIRQFGTSANDYAFAVVVSADGAEYVCGYTMGTLPDQTSAGANDAFVRKYDPFGNVIWTRQFGTPSDDFAYDC